MILRASFPTFAGFTEALQADFKLHAPHLTAHLVMPGFVRARVLVDARLDGGAVVHIVPARCDG